MEAASEPKVKPRANPCPESAWPSERPEVMLDRLVPAAPAVLALECGLITCLGEKEDPLGGAWPALRRLIMRWVSCAWAWDRSDSRHD